MSHLDGMALIVTKCVFFSLTLLSDHFIDQLLILTTSLESENYYYSIIIIDIIIIITDVVATRKRFSFMLSSPPFLL